MWVTSTEDNFKNIRVYWLAFIAYWGLVLFGYDTGIAGGVVSSNYFKAYYGITQNGKTDISKSNNISANVVSVLQAGAFFGALVSIPVTSALGRRPTLFIFCIIFMIGAVITTLAEGNNGLPEIYSGRVISGIGIGAISAVAPTYVSECAPKEVRGRITGMFQIMIAIGVMLSYFINLGVQIHIPSGVNVWRIPFALQLIPAGIMCLGLLTVKESPRWLAYVGRHDEALYNLAYLRRGSIDSGEVVAEMAEIEAAILEEREARKGLGIKEAFLGKGNFVRFVIAFFIFVGQQFCGQNSIGYYAPQIFTSIGYSGTTNSLLASGIYGIVKVIATIFYIFFGVETVGRKYSLFISAMGMGVLFYIVGAILKTHPPVASQPSSASEAMAVLLYIYVCFYSIGWGPLPWVYTADIFPTRTRHYGLAVGSASQWLWNFVVSRVTPQLITELGYKIFIMFATINIGGLAVFSLLIPETKGKSLEEMDIIFGAVSEGDRRAFIERARAEQKRQKPTPDGSNSHLDKV